MFVVVILGTIDKNCLIKSCWRYAIVQCNYKYIEIYLTDLT